MQYRGQRAKIGPPPSRPVPPPPPPGWTGIKVVITDPDASPFDCDECPEDPRPHLHCPWGGMHKHYAPEA